MTPKERASKLQGDMVRAYEVGATMKDLDAVVHFWVNMAEQAIIAAVEEVEDRVANERDSYLETIARLEAAVEEAKAEQASVTAKAERDECLKILQKVYQEWVDGDWAPGEAFESAKDIIRARFLNK